MTNVSTVSSTPYFSRLIVASIQPSDHLIISLSHHLTIWPSDAYAAIGAQNLSAAFASSTATTTTRAVHYRFDTVAFLDPFMRVSAPSVQRLAAQGTQQRSGLLDALVIMSRCVSKRVVLCLSCFFSISLSFLYHVSPFSVAISLVLFS